ncbi:hypothetical protein CY35_08G001900 [Sphagnum magellanicum]|nr:hypothetical protein CY35_08G001900 [Sphagnum magellanicum]
MRCLQDVESYMHKRFNLGFIQVERLLEFTYWHLCLFSFCGECAKGLQLGGRRSDYNRNDSTSKVVR